MSEPRIGSLCSGTGQLDEAVRAVYGGTTAWVSDVCKFTKGGEPGHHDPCRSPCTILAHHYPDAPNLGDFTRTDWSTVEPVDILTAGFPCQPVSNAGKQLGDLDERWLWDDVLRAVREVRPGLVALENVRGLLTARSGGLFGRVVGTLADVGYDVRWHCVKASDVGATHSRFRIFIAATDARSIGRQRRTSLGRAGRVSAEWREACGHAGHRRGPLFPTPTVQDGANNGGPSQYDRNSPPLNALVTLLPTPAVNDMGEGKTVGRWDEWTAAMQARHGNGNGHGKSLAIEAQRLLPTPRASDGPDESSHGRTWSKTDRSMHTIVHLDELNNERWGDYAAAVAGWEHVLGRPAPEPTALSTKGNPQLSACFVEWMMGLPAGWVTDVPGITRNEALKALGNGVVPQQAEAALREMASW